MISLILQLKGDHYEDAVNSLCHVLKRNIIMIEIKGKIETYVLLEEFNLSFDLSNKL